MPVNLSRLWLWSSAWAFGVVSCKCLHCITFWYFECLWAWQRWLGLQDLCCNDKPGAPSFAPVLADVLLISDPHYHETSWGWILMLTWCSKRFSFEFSSGCPNVLLASWLGFTLLRNHGWDFSELGDQFSGSSVFSFLVNSLCHSHSSPVPKMS